MSINEKAFKKAAEAWDEWMSTPNEGVEGGLRAAIRAYEAAKAEQPDGLSIEDAFKAGKEVGEIAGKVAVDALDEARYQRDKIERAYKYLLTEREAAQPNEFSKYDHADDALSLAEGNAPAIPQFSKLPPRDLTIPAEEQGVFEKFQVRRRDGKDKQGKKHYGCEYFVLDISHDIHAKPAMEAYAESCKTTHPILSKNMIKRYGLTSKNRESGWLYAYQQPIEQNGEMRHLIVLSPNPKTSLKEAVCLGRIILNEVEDEASNG